MLKRKNFGAQQVTFRRFGKKGWCIFRSLSLNIRIGVLSVATLASAVSQKAHAEQIEEAQQDSVGVEREMDEVTVSASVAPLTQIEAARIVSVVTRREIEQAGAQSVNDLFKLVSGVDVRQRGGFGVQTDISIDGGTYEQITILLNGVNISNPHTGHLAADFPFSVSDIERIEVLEGAASRVYGGQAFGGAINIVTKDGLSPQPSPRTGKGRKSAWELQVAGEGGMHGTGLGDARVAWQYKGLSMSVSGGGGRSDGGTLNDGWQKGNLYFQGQYEFQGSKVQGSKVQSSKDQGFQSSKVQDSSSKILWQFGYSRKSYGANTFYSGSSNDQWEQNERFLVSVGGDFSLGRLHLMPSVYWNRTYDNYEWHRGKPNNSHQADVYGVKVSGWFNWVAGKTAFGAEIRQEGILSSSLGVEMDEKDWTWGHGAEKQYKKRADRTNVSFNLEHNVLLRRWTVSAGVLANMTTSVDHSFRFYPGVDVAYRPMDGMKLYANYNMGFRLPSFTDLYYNSPDITGNDQLKPERSQNVSVGLSYGRREVSARLKGFYNYGENLIDYVKENWKDVAHADNFDRRSAGLSTDVKWDIARTFGCLERRLETPFYMTVGYTYLWQKREGNYNVFTSLYADDYLKHKLVVGLVHPVWKRLSATWNVRYQKRMGAYQVYEGLNADGNGYVATDQLAEYHPYATLDLKLQWTDRKFDVWVKGTNITDVRFQDIGNIPQPGAWVMAGARLKLAF